MSLEQSGMMTTLPYELQNKIISYLYFSDNTSLKMKQVNETIKNYKTIYLISLFCDYETDLTLVSYFILKYFLYDKIRCDILKLDYSMLSTNHEVQYKELSRIFTNLRLVDILRIFKYIQHQGMTSEFYID